MKVSSQWPAEVVQAGEKLEGETSLETQTRNYPWIAGLNPMCPYFTAISKALWWVTSPWCHEICPLFHTQQSPGRVAGIQTWPCQKRWCCIVRPSGKPLSQITFIRVSLQAQRHSMCLNRCHGFVLVWFSFVFLEPGWKQDVIRAFQMCTFTSPGFSKDEHLNLPSV